MGDVSFPAVMARLQAQLRVSSEAALARALDLAGPDYHNRKRRGTIPWDRIVTLAAERKVTLDALIDDDVAREEPGVYQVLPAPDCPAYRAAVEGVLAALERASAQVPAGQVRRLIDFAVTRPLSADELDRLVLLVLPPGPAPPVAARGASADGDT